MIEKQHSSILSGCSIMWLLNTNGIFEDTLAHALALNRSFSYVSLATMSDFCTQSVTESCSSLN